MAIKSSVPEGKNVSLDLSDHSGEDSYLKLSSAEFSESQNEAPVFAAREKRQARFLRVAVFVFILLATVVACVMSFLVTYDHERTSFQKHYNDYAFQLSMSIQENIERKIVAIDALRISISSYAISRNKTWPFLDIPDFYAQGYDARNQASIQSCVLAPVVTLIDRKAWEEYSMKNLDWITRGNEFEKTLAENMASARSSKTSARRSLQVKESSIVGNVSNKIYSIASDGHPVVVGSREVYMPQWQSSPVNEYFVNYDLLSSADFQRDILAMIKARQAILGNVLHSDTKSPSGDQKSSKLLFPIFGQLVVNESAKVVGMIGATMLWTEVFEHILPEYAPWGVVAVLENQCGSTFSYHVLGHNATYLGEGDFHNSRFDSYLRQFPIFDSFRASEVAKRSKGVTLMDRCNYIVRVYPSQEIYDFHFNKLPYVLLGVLCFACILVALAFCRYEQTVRLRHDDMEVKAAQSQAIVSSIFPAAFQERLFNGTDDSSSNHGAFSKQQPQAKSVSGTKLKTSIAGDNESEVVNGENRNETDVERRLPRKKKDELRIARPIADSFPATTILFADVVGFTAWSSQREPGEVFTLLQSVYREFDLLAKKLGKSKEKHETVDIIYIFWFQPNRLTSC